MKTHPLMKKFLALRGTGAPTVVVLSLLICVLAAGAAGAYVVVLKDGTQIITAKEYEVDGDRVILRMRNGTTAFYDADDVDFAKTDKLNENGGMGGAKFIEDKVQTVDSIDADIKDPDSLSDIVGGRGLTLPEHSKREVRQTEDGPQLPMTAGGFVDLMRVERAPFDDPEVNQEILTYLEGQGHDHLRVFRGVVENQPLLEVRANTESEVFKGIRDAASALVQIGQRFPDRVQAFDLLFLTEQEVRGGQFSMTAEQAQLIVSGRLEPQLYFLRYVEF